MQALSHRSRNVFSDHVGSCMELRPEEKWKRLAQGEMNGSWSAFVRWGAKC